VSVLLRKSQKKIQDVVYGSTKNGKLSLPFGSKGSFKEKNLGSYPPKSNGIGVPGGKKVLRRQSGRLHEQPGESKGFGRIEGGAPCNT